MSARPGDAPALSGGTLPAPAEGSCKVSDAPTFGAARERLGHAIHLEGPAPADVTARYLADPKFAAMLYATRMFPEWRARLLDDAMNAHFDPERAAPDDAAAIRSDAEGANGVDTLPPPSAAALVRKAAMSVSRWAATGFQSVEPWLREKRRAACLSCDQLRDAASDPAQWLVKRTSGRDGRFCGACNCPIARKIALPAETCPMPSPHDPKMSRWGEFL